MYKMKHGKHNLKKCSKDDKRECKKNKADAVNHEFEAALLAQRQKHQADLEVAALPIPAIIVRIPGMVYDASSGKYFKSGVFNSKPDTLIQSCVSIAQPLRAQSSVIHSLHNRLLKRNDSLQLCNLITARTIKLALPQFGATVITNCGSSPAVHGHHGIALAHNSKFVVVETSNRQNAETNFNVCASWQNIPLNTMYDIHWHPSNDQKVITLLESSMSSGQSRLRTLSIREGGPLASLFVSSKIYNDVVKCCGWNCDGTAVIMCRESGVYYEYLENNHCETVKYLDTKSSSPAVAVCSSSADLLTVGLRNGSVVQHDLRTSQGIAGLQIAKMKYRIDQLAVFHGGDKLLAQDVSGQVAVYDVRRPNCVLHVMCPGNSNLIRHRGFWLSPDEQLLATSREDTVFGSGWLNGVHLDIHSLAAQGVRDERPLHSINMTHYGRDSSDDDVRQLVNRSSNPVHQQQQQQQREQQWLSFASSPSPHPHLAPALSAPHCYTGVWGMWPGLCGCVCSGNGLAPPAQPRIFKAVMPVE